MHLRKSSALFFVSTILFAILMAAYYPHKERSTILIVDDNDLITFVAPTITP